MEDFQESRFWWRPFARHLWRAFFALETIKPDNWRPEDQRKHELVKPIFDEQSPENQQILYVYFTSKWREDVLTLEQLSKEKNIDLDTLRKIIKAAEQQIVRNLGLL